MQFCLVTVRLHCNVQQNVPRYSHADFLQNHYKCCLYKNFYWFAYFKCGFKQSNTHANRTIAEIQRKKESNFLVYSYPFPLIFLFLNNSFSFFPHTIPHTHKKQGQCTNKYFIRNAQEDSHFLQNAQSHIINDFLYHNFTTHSIDTDMQIWTQRNRA